MIEDLLDYCKVKEKVEYTGTSQTSCSYYLGLSHAYNDIVKKIEELKDNMQALGVPRAVELRDTRDGSNIVKQQIINILDIITEIRKYLEAN